MIVSSQNEAIKNIRRLRRSKGEHAILEGPHLVQEALRLGLALDPVLVTPEFAGSAAGSSILQSLDSAPTVVDGALLGSLADADAPRGLLAVANLPRFTIDDVPFGPDDVWLFLDSVQDPGNLGALARVAEGLGARGLLLSPGCADSRHSRALRASAGSLLRLPVATGVEASTAARKLASIDATWVGLEAHSGAEELSSFDIERPFVLALGSEGSGLSAATQAILGRSVTIELAGRLESLNVVVAAALVLAKLRRS